MTFSIFCHFTTSECPGINLCLFRNLHFKKVLGYTLPYPTNAKTISDRRRQTGFDAARRNAALCPTYNAAESGAGKGYFASAFAESIT